MVISKYVGTLQFPRKPFRMIIASGLSVNPIYLLCGQEYIGFNNRSVAFDQALMVRIQRFYNHLAALYFILHLFAIYLSNLLQLSPITHQFLAPLPERD